MSFRSFIAVSSFAQLAFSGPNLPDSNALALEAFSFPADSAAAIRVLSAADSAAIKSAVGDSGRVGTERLKIPLPAQEPRPEGAKVDVLVIHRMCAPHYSDSLSVANCIQTLKHERSATHYLIARDGQIIECVDEDMAAHHAGRSRMPFKADRRRRVSEFSIGIELIAGRGMPYTQEQYDALARLTAEICERHPIHSILGHQHVAYPRGRRSDPGHKFSWSEFKKLTEQIGADLSKIKFPDALLPQSKKK